MGSSGVKMTKFICLLALGGLVSAHPQDFLGAIGGLLGRAGGGRGIDSQQSLLSAATGLRNAILGNPALQSRILKNDLNPCDGVAPNYCQCTDGTRFSFGIEYNDNPCTGGGVPDQCYCPNGNTFKLVNVEIVQSGQQPGRVGKRCGGGLPRSCTCPGGREITRNEFISRIIPAVQDILG